MSATAVQSVDQPVVGSTTEVCRACSASATTAIAAKCPRRSRPVDTIHTATPTANRCQRKIPRPLTVNAYADPGSCAARKCHCRAGTSSAAHSTTRSPTPRPSGERHITAARQNAMSCSGIVQYDPSTKPQDASQCHAITRFARRSRLPGRYQPSGAR